MKCKQKKLYRLIYIGGSGRSRGEQVPKRRAPPLDIRKEHKRVGEVGEMGDPVQRALEQCALAHPDT